MRIVIVLENFSPHLSANKDQRVGEWAGATNVELARALQRQLAQPDRTSLRPLPYFALNRTDYASHEEQNSMIRRYNACRNRLADDDALRATSMRAKVA